jgi:formamidopyrimidine-DNA glycosylase
LPELPEVETVRRDLEESFTGQAMETVLARGARTFRRHTHPDEVESKLTGRTLCSVGRRGKYLVGRLDNSEVMVVHLGMSGQLLTANPGDAVPLHTHLVVGFSGGSRLLFVDPRTFGEVFVTSSSPDGHVGELSHLGFDALGELPSPAGFSKLLATRRTRLKPLLMDQRFIAGIGNIYSDEILFRARLRHDRPAAGLTDTEVRRLRGAIAKILGEGVARRGSTLADLQYRDLRGESGTFQRFHRVYGREGLGCARCGSTILRQRAAGRSTYFCPQCQI